MLMVSNGAQNTDFGGLENFAHQTWNSMKQGRQNYKDVLMPQTMLCAASH